MAKLTPTQRMQRLEKLAWLLDASIRLPGTRFRFGLDGLVGLVPGIGDLIGALVSLYIMFQSARAGAPGSVLLRMLGNIVIEALVGLVPLLGDVFDMAFRANLRNVALLRNYQQQPATVHRESRGRLWLVVLAAVLVLIVLTCLVAGLFNLLLGAVSG